MKKIQANTDEHTNAGENWSRLVMNAYQINDYPWPNDYDQFTGLIQQYHQILRDFSDDTVEALAVRSLAEASLTVLRRIPPEAIDGHIERIGVDGEGRGQEK